MNTCKTCGGPVNRVGNYYVCEYCRNKWEIDSGNDVHAVDRANAWSALRDGDFEKAAELFENIIAKEAKNHEAYWGRGLALAGIVYVTDMRENKKVPTCNNITENSFINDKDVQRAISLAPADIATGYKEQAEYIEKVRLEWLEKASKEPAYDVFISFKDSDRENGIERTQDSIDAQDLYNALVAEGYKVFFSRISLRDKISEQYEPYIYNAIKTAKVMIVFGEKAEYFSSVWIKNEWSRFKTRIEKGEKHKNSLVVVYKNMNPGDLPVVLRSRQCLNAADMTFLSDLNRHIKRVVEETKNVAQLERVEIVGGQVAVKATKVNVNAIQMRTLSEGASPETNISEQQTLSLAAAYLEHNDFEKAKQLAEEVLFDNPGNSMAVRIEFLAKHKVADEQSFENLKSFNDYAGLHKVFTCVDKKNAAALLSSIYKMRNMPDGEYAKLLHEVLPYVFDDREEYIDALFGYATECGGEKIFSEILPTIPENAVDTYIDRLYKFASALVKAKNSHAMVYIQKILECNASHQKALKLRLNFDIELNTAAETMVAHIKDMLRYAKNVDKTLLSILKMLYSVPATVRLEAVCNQALKFYCGELSAIEQELLDIARWLIQNGLFTQAEYYLKLVLGFNKDNSEVFKALCMIKAKVKDWSNIGQSRILLSDLPEFNKYMAMCSVEERDKLFESLKDNRRYFLAQKQMLLGMHKTCSDDLAIDPNGNVIALKEDISYWKSNNNCACYSCKLDALTWKNIVSIHEEFETVVGLRSDGTVAISSNQAHLAEVRTWRNIVAIVVSEYSSFVCGLRKDGTVCVACKKDDAKKFDSTKEWRNIESISSNGDSLFGLRSDGDDMRSGWVRTRHTGDVIAISGGVALRRNGSVFLAGSYVLCRDDADRWKNIMSIYSGRHTYAGLSMDGNVKISTTERSDWKKVEIVSTWKNIIELGFDDHNITALCADGSVKTTSQHKEHTKYTNVAEVGADYVILRDGTFVDNIYGAGPKVRVKPEINTWEDYDAYKNEIWNPKPIKYEAPTTNSKYEAPTTNSTKASGGCYVATAVYGSYDCPEVWTLRRFRDNTLAASWYGRTFIRLYYAVSPTLVKWFGKTKWFIALWKTKLDKLVSKLQSQGVADTPYEDKDF